MFQFSTWSENILIKQIYLCSFGRNKTINSFGFGHFNGKVVGLIVTLQLSFIPAVKMTNKKKAANCPACFFLHTLVKSDSKFKLVLVNLANFRVNHLVTHMQIQIPYVSLFIESMSGHTIKTFLVPLARQTLTRGTRF